MFTLCWLHAANNQVPSPQPSRTLLNPPPSPSGARGAAGPGRLPAATARLPLGGGDCAPHLPSRARSHRPSLRAVRGGYLGDPRKQLHCVFFLLKQGAAAVSIDPCTACTALQYSSNQRWSRIYKGIGASSNQRGTLVPAYPGDTRPTSSPASSSGYNSINVMNV